MKGRGKGVGWCRLNRSCQNIRFLKKRQFLSFYHWISRVEHSSEHGRCTLFLQMNALLRETRRQHSGSQRVETLEEVSRNVTFFPNVKSDKKVCWLFCLPPNPQIHYPPFSALLSIPWKTDLYKLHFLSFPALC